MLPRILVIWVLGFSALGAATLSFDDDDRRVVTCTFYSAALGREMPFVVVLPVVAPPDGAEIPVLYLLHGLGRNERTLLSDPFCRRALLATTFAIVLPRGEKSWYVDSRADAGDRYAQYVDEVIATAEANFPVAKSPSRRAVTGWSMGGYGAAYTALRRPGDFAALATMIGVVDFPRARIEPAAQNYDVPAPFGDDPEVWAQMNPRLLLARSKPLPMLVAYADRTPETQMNEAFVESARSAGHPVRTLLIPGAHVFTTVREMLPAVLGFMELQLNPPAGKGPPVRSDPAR